MKKINHELNHKDHNTVTTPVNNTLFSTPDL